MELIDDECNSSEMTLYGREGTVEGKSSKSWVYLHSEKRDFNGKPYFYCLIINKAGKTCHKRFDASDGNTSGISKHLKISHSLLPPNKLVQPKLHEFKMGQIIKEKTFREAFAELVVKQYLPYSLIQEKVLQDSYLFFHKQFLKTRVQPNFVSDKTVAADIEKWQILMCQKLSSGLNPRSLCVWMFGLAPTECLFWG
jgi:hypothetical protein